MQHTLLLFDIDGTLLDSGGIGQHAMRTVGQETFEGKLDFKNVRFSGMLDPNIYQEAAQAGGLNDPQTHHQRFHDAYIEELTAELDRRSDESFILPGVIELLKATHAHDGTEMGLLTGNYAAAVPLKLRHAGIDIDRFAVTAFGNEAPTRRELVGLAMHKYQAIHNTPAQARRVIVIGDTPRDIDCAKANGCRVLAVATGRFTAQQLREAGADTVVDDLADASVLMAML